MSLQDTVGVEGTTRESTVWLRTRRSGVRIPPGAPLFQSLALLPITGHPWTVVGIVVGGCRKQAFETPACPPESVISGQCAEGSAPTGIIVLGCQEDATALQLSEGYPPPASLICALGRRTLIRNYFGKSRNRCIASASSPFALTCLRAGARMTDKAIGVPVIVETPTSAALNVQLKHW